MNGDSAQVWLKIDLNDPISYDPLRPAKRRPALFMFMDALAEEHSTLDSVLISIMSVSLYNIL